MSQGVLTPEAVEQFSRLYMGPVIQEMRDVLGSDFLARLHMDDFDEKKELEDLKINEKAIAYSVDVFEKIIDRMKGN